MVPAVSCEIPLLPLPVVLFPGTFLPVKLSAETHRMLLTECVRNGERVGVILLPGEAEGTSSTVPCTTGCLATVTMMARVAEQDDDEPIDAILFGERRIRVMDFVQQDPYLTGRVEFLDEYGGLHVERRTEQASRLFDQYLDLIRQRYGTDVVEYSLPHDPTLASYLLASVLYLPLEVKQRWLESASTALRLQEELNYLRAECEKHSTMLALSETMQCNYTAPDPHLYISLTSQN